ncbi:Serine-threonine phosphatase 2B, catalytic subunit [Pseudoloma neurophilia]|uniref:Serine/threonine-protein phosphatase n=1 Tax=Pseudoloma neurophilia TaxID=146866 RepID=A0A0R0LY57_9MICR|nr:Serine-threonine phosphatase 2B, catalytic subunit [Pseudoloma neurophilia]
MDELPSLEDIVKSTSASRIIMSSTQSENNFDETVSIDDEMSDPTPMKELVTDRVRKVFKPTDHFLDEIVLMDQKKDCFDTNVIKTHLYNQGKLSIEQANSLTKNFIKLVKKEPNLLRIDQPSTVFGDIHGQYYDMLKVLKSIDLNTETVVFVGDYVDRGSFSTEVFIYLMTLKLAHPKNVFLLRGNHESMEMTKYFSFKKECTVKYDESFYKLSLEAFKALPLAAIVMNKMFCVHGGISPQINRIEEINSINRFTEPSQDSPLIDLLWSDPHPFYDTLSEVKFTYNKNRRCSYFYTFEAVKEFLESNNLWTIVRGHEVQENGFTLFKEYREDIPSVITIFSAPNYCDVYKNRGAFLKFNGENIQIKKFKEDDHPFVLPGFVDAFNWSFPFLSNKMGELFLDLMNVRPSESSTTTSSTTSEIDEDIKEVQTFTNAMSLLREEREGLNEFVDEESTELTKDNIKNVITPIEDDFVEVKVKDIPNELFKTKENIIKGMSMDTVPSFTNEISKEVENQDLKQIVEETQVIETSPKNIKVVLPEKTKSEKAPSLFDCCFKRE